MGRLAEAVIVASVVTLTQAFALAETGDSAASSVAEAHGSLSQETIRLYIQRANEELRVCYVEQLARFPELSGRVEIRFVIAPNGRVSAASIGSSTVGNAEMEQCLVRVMRGITFPRPKGGGVVITTFPFTFEPPRGTAPRSRR